MRTKAPGAKLFPMATGLRPPMFFPWDFGLGLSD
jgi:hypothetical protein